MKNKRINKSKSNSDRQVFYIVSIILASVLLTLSNFGLLGMAGNAVSGFMFGMIGWIQYIVPMYLGVLFCFKYLAADRVKQYRFIKWIGVVLVLLAVVIQMIKRSEFTSLIDLYVECSSGKDGGGLLLGGLSQFLYLCLDYAGMSVLLIAIFLISFIEMTGVSLLGSFKRINEKTVNEEKKAEKEKRAKKAKKEAISKFQIQKNDNTNALKNDSSKPQKNDSSKPEKKEHTDKQKKPIVTTAIQTKSNFNLPPLSLLHDDNSKHMVDIKMLEENSQKIVSTLANFGIPVEVVDYFQGASVTRYELIVDPTVNLSKIGAYSNNLMSALATKSVRVIAPIPGRSTVGIEVANSKRETVYLRKLLESREYLESTSKLEVAIGEDVEGHTVMGDISKMPHLLIAGTSGSGKSVLLNSLLVSLLYKCSPDEVRLIIIDPKEVEFSEYFDIPHLLLPVVTDSRKAAPALEWVVSLMEERYSVFAESGADNIASYNEAIRSGEYINEDEIEAHEIPYILVVLDEYADLVMVAGANIKSYVMRLGQKARAAGIHLILSTQRPSAKIVDGDIKANIPGLIALKASSATNSRVIMETNGAEKLLKNGDMFFDDSVSGLVRAQGALIEKSEVKAVMDYIRSHNPPVVYEAKAEEQIEEMSDDSQAENDDKNGKDELYDEVAEYAMSLEKLSIGTLQRKYRIGFNRAARIMDQLYEGGIVGPENGTKPRDVLNGSER